MEGTSPDRIDEDNHSPPAGMATGSNCIWFDGFDLDSGARDPCGITYRCQSFPFCKSL